MPGHLSRTERPGHQPLLGQLAERLDGFVLGRKPDERLPVAIRATITADQRSSEILVCLVQFMAVGFFGTFYAVAPKAFPPDVPFAPVPWALGLYALFTGARLWLAVRGRLGPAFLSISVVVDIAVLMVTIWSFHLQYDEPATIYLKAPTLLYVFILIALRAMRFEAAYVILAGVSAIVGWFVLVAYAVATAEDMSITHDFADYMTSRSVLIGAEIDKLMSIGIVTAILTIVVIRARRLLVLAVAETHAARELSRFFAPGVAGEIREAGSSLGPGYAETRAAAIMIIDLRGFTAFTRHRERRETLAVLRDYHTRFVPLIARHGGVIDKYLGDGIIATFGAVAASQTYAADALEALHDVLRAHADWQVQHGADALPPPGIGVAVTVGSVLFGVTGTDERPEFTVIGDPVNLASKLEKHCKQLGVRALTTTAALDTARRQGFRPKDVFQVYPSVLVAGVDEPLDLLGLD